MTFARVIPAGTSPCRHCGWSCRHRHVTHHHGHTATTRRQLAAWDTAVYAWRLWRDVTTAEAFHNYKDAERTWMWFNLSPGGPNSTALHF